MKKMITCLLFLAAVFLLSGFTGAIGQEASAEKIFRSISPEEAVRMLQQREDIIFLDIRTAKERSRGYIPGSQLAAFNDVAMGRLQLPENKPILLVCAVGGRSYFAGQILAKKGHREVYNLSAVSYTHLTLPTKRIV